MLEIIIVDHKAHGEEQEDIKIINKNILIILLNYITYICLKVNKIDYYLKI